MSARAVNRSRTYDNSGRVAQAQRTRRRVVAVAYELLLDKGYAATKLSDVAARAGVSVETIYKGFGSKAALTKQVYDVTLAGDDEPVPMSERPEIKAIVDEPDPRRKAALYAALGRRLGERLGPLLAILLRARGADPDLEAFARTIANERLAGNGAFVGLLADAGALRPGLDSARARDLLWALTSPELYQLLVIERGWSPDEYESWLATAITDALLAEHT
jgi:AcrR family transcriptional regulator